MNGKAAKRIRIAARIISRDGLQFEEQYNRLKREYKTAPYHKRSTPEVVGHSAMLRRYHTFRTKLSNPEVQA